MLLSVYSDRTLIFSPRILQIKQEWQSQRVTKMVTIGRIEQCFAVWLVYQDPASLRHPDVLLGSNKGTGT
jgi:hypothetical protein